MNENTQIYLRDIAFRVNALVDGGGTVPLDQVYQQLEDGNIIEWLDESGADMSILLSGKMDDEKGNVIRILQQVGNSFKGRERRKMGIENNGFCLLIGLVFEALAIGID